MLNLVWNSIPMQLAKENKKYIYGQVREGARAKDFELAIQWLLDCGLIHKVNRVKKPALPLKAYFDLDAKVIIEGNRIFTEFKGALTDQFVLQQLIAEVGTEPYYYSTLNSKGEIDFLIQGKTSMSDYREQDWMENIPLYNIDRLSEYIEK